jgi:hypothetical protein
MDSKELRGKWALVTGASSGLGVDFARELACRGASLLLVARRKERLEEVASELRSAHGVEADALALDLEARGAAADLYDQVRSLGRSVDILVNNAGFGIYGKFLDLPWEREAAMLDLDIVALVHLTRLFAPDMVQRGWGRILQVASIGAFQACPTYAAYGAAKAFVLNFGEAFNHELRGTGVSCTVVSPGVTATEFHQVAGQKMTAYQRLMLMTSRQVAAAGIRALLAQRSSVVPGFMNALGAWSMRFLPRRLATALAYRTMRDETSAEAK